MAFRQTPSTRWWRRQTVEPIRPRLRQDGAKRPRRGRPPRGPQRALDGRPALAPAIKEKAMPKKSTSGGSKGRSKVHKVMKEHKEGKLKSGSGKKVKSRKQAVAIALNEARRSGAKIPKKKSRS